jgi:hypothetical protein
MTGIPPHSKVRTVGILSGTESDWLSIAAEVAARLRETAVARENAAAPLAPRFPGFETQAFSHW